MAQKPGIGLFNINNFVCSEPENLVRVAEAAEAAGYDSLWTGEHVVLPDPQAPPSPVAPEGRMLDPAVALTFAAAHTSRVKLGTGIIILPQRNPLVLAKELASVDVLSGGRLLFGVGVGYLKAEFDAIGASLEDRGTRTLEYVEAMRQIWSADKPRYDGRYVSFSGVVANPRPLQQPGPPVIMGGNSKPAYRRSVTHGDGWYGYALDVDATAAALEGLRAAAQRYERPDWLGELEITVTPRGRLDAAKLERFGELGVHRLVIVPRGDDVDAWLRYVEDNAALITS
ncbi:MAG: TIGR03619 family F420-dependent LLM class oxidoreductase [Acidimicrobiia bacterium]|nr:TIGR03619 family F420-dependent LLM class oxidoreductase [Acidimicrobiia bacterium]